MNISTKKYLHNLYYNNIHTVLKLFISISKIITPMIFLIQELILWKKISTFLKVTRKSGTDLNNWQTKKIDQLTGW